jgi:hypothetical protein
VERTVAKKLDESDLVFSDHRTTRSLVFFRSGRLAPTSKTTMAFEGLDAPHFPAGAYVLVDKQEMDFLTRAYEYRQPAFTTDPPPAWKVVWRRDSAILYHVLRPSRALGPSYRSAQP